MTALGTKTKNKAWGLNSLKQTTDCTLWCTYIDQMHSL